jgi:ethanolamine utilization protein EutN
MRIARVIGTVTLTRRVAALKSGTLLIADVLDASAAAGNLKSSRRKTPMPESLVVFDDLGAGEGQLIAVSEGAEATMPFRPASVPIDAYNAAILDTVEFTPH